MILQEQIEKYNKNDVSIYDARDLARGIINKQTEMLKVAKEALNYAIWQYEGNGTPQHGHWCGKAREALATIEEMEK